MIGEQAKARVVSALLEDEFEVIPLSPGFVLTAPAESEDRRVTFPLDPLRMLFVPFVSQKSSEITGFFCFGKDWITECGLLVKGMVAVSSSLCCFRVCWGVEVSLGDWKEEEEQRDGGCWTGLLPFDHGSFSRLTLNSPLLSLWARLSTPFIPGK